MEVKRVGRAGALLEAVAADAGVPVMAREVFAGLAEELVGLELRLAAADQKLRVWHRANEVSQRLLAVPGIGPVGASLLAMKVPDPGAFKSGRDFAAWLSLTPKDHSTAGNQRWLAAGGSRPAASSVSAKLRTFVACQPSACRCQ